MSNSCGLYSWGTLLDSRPRGSFPWVFSVTTCMCWESTFQRLPLPHVCPWRFKSTGVLRRVDWLSCYRSFEGVTIHKKIDMT